MGRAEVGTPKWLANKMKAKGLQKLRWYCQMCEKQCRDENGFKCHRMSESHQRQMQVFSQHPDRFMDDFSKEFESAFMKLMKTRYCRTRILANTVYMEMIGHREHIHMNSTIWVTLSEFVQYLGQSGKCKIDLTPKGWFIEYIDREKLEREKQERNKMKNERTIDEINERRINALVSQAQEAGFYENPNYTTLERTNDEKFSIKNFSTKTNSDIPASITKKENIFLEYEKNSIQTNNCINNSDTITLPDKKRKLSTLDQIMLQNEEKKGSHKNGNSKLNHVRNVAASTEQPGASEMIPNECWLSPGLIVKIIETEDSDLYKAKAEIIDVSLSKSQARLKLLNKSTEVVKNQSSLETVIPKKDGPIRIVSGKFKGLQGTLIEVDQDRLIAKVKINTDDPAKVIEELQLDEICKYALINSKIT